MMLTPIQQRPATALRRPGQVIVPRRARAAAATTTLGGVPGQVAWFDGFDAPSFVAGAPGYVNAWTDKLGGLTAQQTSGALQPTYDTSTGLVTFDGEDDWLALDTAAFPDLTKHGPGITVMFVFGTEGRTSVQNSLLVAEGTEGDFLFINFISNQLRAGCGSLQLQGDASDRSLSVWAAVFRPGNDAVQSVYRDGVIVDEVTLPVGMQGDPATAQARLGRHTNGGNPLEGDIGQVAIWHRPLNTAELNAAGAAAGAPYGLTWSTVT